MKVDLNDHEMAIIAVSLGSRLDLMRKRLDNDPAELAQAEALKFKLRLGGEAPPRTNSNSSSKITGDSIEARLLRSTVTDIG